LSKILTLKNTAERNSVILSSIVFALGGLGYLAEGAIYSAAEAIELIDALSQSALYLGTAVAGSSGTILALMLTLIGIVKRTDSDFDDDIYRRINLVGLHSTVALIGAVILLLLLSLPVGEYNKIPGR